MNQSRSLRHNIRLMVWKQSLFSKLVLFGAMNPGNITVAAIKQPFTTGPKFPWCRTACVNKANGEITIESPDPIREIKDRIYDTSQSADWMEYLEEKESRLEDEGGAGAYDTLRCDIKVSSPVDSMPYRSIVWGESFHLHRLKNSFMALLEAKRTVDASSRDIQCAVDEAMKRSQQTLHSLLSSANSDKTLNTNHSEMKSDKNKEIKLVRITILWSPSKSSTDPTEITVRGHACSSAKTVIPDVAPNPIVASVAVNTSEEGGLTVDSSLPTRHADPQNKIASWCRLRRTMETKNYKSPGIEEVLMVRPRKDEKGEERLEVLEGLSSNLFVVYKDETVRTATEGCLHGYVRHLVLENLIKCGLKFDPRPVYLNEIDQWREAFITSSSRLIYPISKIVLPEGEQKELRELWHDEVLTRSECSSRSKWQLLLNEILKEQGYSGDN